MGAGTLDQKTRRGTLRPRKPHYILAMQPNDLIPVDSSAVAAWRYDAPTRTLFLRFHTGTLYAYLHVPAAVAEAFEAAPSKGRFFADHIDPAFRYARLDVS